MATLRLRSRSVLGLVRDASHDRTRLLLSTPPYASGQALRFLSSPADHNRPPRRRTRGPWHKDRIPWWRKNEKLPLGVDSLGSPGQITVLKPGHRNRRTRGEPKATPDPGPMTLDAILGDLKEEASAPALSTIEDAIETYRPSNTKLTVAVGESIRMNLTAAFTASQLSDYIAKYKTPHPREELLTRRWWPQKVRSGRNSGKGSLAEHVLRDCWQVDITDEAGQLDLHLRSPLINLLLNAEHFSFERIANLHRASIDVTHSVGLVQITGQRHACESVAEVISDAVSRVQQVNVGLGPEASHLDLGPVMSPRFLEWLGHTYGVAVEQGPFKSSAKILYLTENEACADSARRTLDLAISQVTSAPVPFSTYFPASELADLYHTHPEASLSWFDRQRQWFRWSRPAVETVGKDGDQTPFFDNHKTRLSDELLKLLRAGPAPPVTMEDGADWSESVTAFVGKCLFAPKSSLASATLSASQLGKSSSPRAFATDIPRVMPFLDSLPPMTPVINGRPLYRLRLKPSLQNTAALPDVQVTFTIEPRTYFYGHDFVEIHDLKLVLSANHVDYLLPENGLDLRFTREIYRSVQNNESPKSHALKEDIKKSLQNVFCAEDATEASIGQTAFATISFPVHLLPTTDAAAQEGPGMNDTLTAEYLLPPLSDIRGAHVQRYTFDDREVHCSFSDLGPFLPVQTTELSLSLELLKPGSVPERGPSPATLDPAFHSFYNSACSLAFQTHRARYSALDD
ncbi:hypothetical protein N7492_001910 [Penicillium capsulatum]|uniref:Respiratory complex assembly protein Rmp1 n=1 Tax=Penicillium capsulatum TaxID=69766 RepID=A0A9W9IHL1_9EURO|nr:hypothetical protein N7492_001910 [Penicillium capsulatum]KAJ6123467.1 hypothetical protein N7512_005932 [Penicillium capsulatum]